MSQDVVNLADLVTRTSIALPSDDLSKREIELVVRRFIDELTHALSSGETVKLPGFGVLETRHRASRNITTPHGPRVAKPSNVVKFRALTGLKRAVNHES